MKLICLLSIIALLTLSGASRCPYSGLGKETHGILIRGNGTHLAIDNKLIPKAGYEYNNGTFWKCEMIVRDNTPVKDCKLYERIEFTWENTTNSTLDLNETNETEQIEEPVRLSLLGNFISDLRGMFTE